MVEGRWAYGKFQYNLACGRRLFRNEAHRVAPQLRNSNAVEGHGFGVQGLTDELV